MSGARCVLFGGTGAVGGAVLEQLAARGARVAFTYHAREDLARRRAEEQGATAVQVNLADVSSVERAVDAAVASLGGVDAFVQCAGVAARETPESSLHPTIPEIGEPAWDRMLDVLVKGSFFAARSVTSRMARGNVVLMGSVDGVKSARSPVHYATAHGAISAMARAMAKELGVRQIRVNVVAPGPLEAGQASVTPPELKREFLRHSGLRRLGRVAEIASVVTWLALDNTYVTGRTVCLDGGL